jgi:hypothetical protein
MAGGLSPSLSDQYAFSIATIVSFGVLGFLMGYLYTRLFLAGAFSRADRNSIQAARERRGADLVEKATTILRQELPAGANQSDQKVTDGQVAAAQRVRDLPQARDPESALAALRSLAREYDQVRAEMASGRERTDRMTKIVHTMRALALAGYGELDRFARSPNSAGERLVAIAMLQVQPDPTYFPWLIERISHEQPFVAFQAIEALHRAAVSPDPRIVDTVRGLIDQWISTADFKNLVAVENDRSELFIFILKTLGIRY